MHYQTIFMVSATDKEEANYKAEGFLAAESGHTNDGFIIENVVPLAEKVDELRKLNEELKQEMDEKEKGIEAGNKDYFAMSDVADYRRGVMFPGVPLYNATDYACAVPNDITRFWAVTVDQHI